MNTPILVRHTPELLTPGGSFEAMRPCLSFPGLRLAQANHTTADQRTSRVFFGTASATASHSVNPLCSDDPMTTLAATYYIVRTPDDRLVATACSKREAWEITKSDLSGPRPRVYLVNTYLGIEDRDYDEQLVYEGA